MTNDFRKTRKQMNCKTEGSSFLFTKSVTLFSSALLVSSLGLPIASLAAETTEDTGASQNEVSNNTSDSAAGEAVSLQQTNSDSSTDQSETTASTEVQETGSTTGSASVEETAESDTDTGSSSTEDSSVTKEQTSESVQAVTTTVLASSLLSSTNVTPSTFISSVAEYARTVAANNDLYASIMIAQAILESGWGSSTLSKAPNYNLFGIKGSYNGQSVTMRTAEQDSNGNVYYVDAAFRKYPSYAESFLDNAHVLKTTSFSSGVYYYSGAWKSNTSSYKEATAYLTGRYATDVSYGTKLNNLIATYNLTQYDSASTGTDTTGTSSSGSSTDTSSGSATGTTYKVVSGDTLWAIANKYGTSVAQLKSWNSLSSDTIYVGQSLVVSQSSSAGSISTTGNSTSSSTSTSTSTTAAVTTYKVVSGDTLWAVANKYGTSVAQLKSWNSLSGDTIYVGQSLVVSQSSSAGSSSTTGNSTSSSTSTSTTATGTTYKVVSGDTLWAVANKYGTSVAQLKSWNNLSTDVIYIGQQLKVSNTSTSQSAGSATVSTVSSNTYTVKSGDTLWALAKNNNTTVLQLKQWNSLSQDTIFVGKSLRVS